MTKLRPPFRLSREIAFWLAIKLALLTAIYFAFFRPALRPHIDVPSHLLSSAAAKSIKP